MFESTKIFFTDKSLLIRFLVLILGLMFFRFLAAVPVPQVDVSLLTTIISQNQFLGVFNIFSGGGLENFSIVMLGVIPYITVSIIVTVLTSVSTSLNSLYNEQGEIGRKKVNRWVRIITVPVAAINAIGLLLYFQTQQLIPSTSLADFVSMVVLIVTGTMIALWIGELITEFGIGNGISLIIFGGIVVNIPNIINQIFISFTESLLPLYIIGSIGVLIFISIAVWVNEGYRPIPASYARYGAMGSKQSNTYLPIKVNAAGVLPIIFSLSLIAFFQFLFRFFESTSVGWLSVVGTNVSNFLANGYLYSIPAAILTFYLTFFTVPLVFNTKKVSTNLEKGGAFVPGLRPGEETKNHFDQVLSRITFYAAVFLSFVAVLPFLLTGSAAGTFTFAIFGTGLLIVVSVVLDVYKKTKSRIEDLSV